MKRDVLCIECQRKFDAHEISELDVRVSRLLYKLSRRFFEPDIEFRKALEIDGLIVLLCTGKIGSIIGRRGIIVAEMSRDLGKKVRIVEKSRDEKKMIQDFVGMARVIGVDKVFRQEGTSFKVKIAKADEGKAITDATGLEKGIKLLLNADVTIEFV